MGFEKLPSGAKSAIRFRELVIGFEILERAFETYLQLRQLGKLKEKNMPKNIKDLNIVTEAEFHKERQYSYEKMIFHIIQDVFNSVVAVLILSFNMIAVIWQISKTVALQIPFLSPDNEFHVGLIYIGFEYFRSKLISIPFEIYYHFVLEEKHGFNKQTFGDFIKDEIKSAGIMCVLAPPILKIFLLILDYGGRNFYIYAVIFVLILVLSLSIIWPNFIAPLFNTFKEIKEGELADAIKLLARQNEFPLSKIYEMDGSKRSAHSNAYFFGFWNHKRIVLYDTLIKHLDVPQIIAILRHEIAHWKFNHTWITLGLGLVNIFVIFFSYGQVMYYDGFYESFGFTERTNFIGLMLFMMLFQPINFIFTKFMLWVSRTNEFQADTFAAMQGDPQILSEALAKTIKENASNMDPDQLYSAFNHTHPDLMRRLENIQNVAKRK